MLKVVLLILAFSSAFANPALDDQDLWPLSENPSDLYGSANLGEIANDEAAKSPDQNLFMDGSASIGEYPNLGPQLNAAEVNNNDGLLAGLGSPSEPFNPLDPFGLNNKVGPPEPNLAPPLDFPLPDCGTRYFLCCSGRQFGAGLYSKCNWCMSFSYMKYGYQREEKEFKQIVLTLGTQMMRTRRTAKSSTFSFAAIIFL